MCNPVYKTIYLQDYIWHEVQNNESLKPKDCFGSSLVKEQYLSPTEEDALSERNVKLIDKLHKDRMKTSYQVSYCREYRKIGEGPSGSLADDAFLHEMEDFYTPHPERKVLTPLATTRRVFSYGRPDYYRTGVSEYKDNISRRGWDIFKRDMDAGVVRLERKGRHGASSSISQGPTFILPINRNNPVIGNDAAEDNGDHCVCRKENCECPIRNN